MAALSPLDRAVLPLEGAGIRRIRSSKTRAQVLRAAQRLFSRYGLESTRLEDIASAAGLTRAGVLKHFDSKDELFYQVHREAVLSSESYLDAPKEILEAGFFEILRYWWSKPEHLEVEADELHRRRIETIGKHATDLHLQERIGRLWLTEDPDGTIDLVQLGMERGDIRRDLDPLYVAVVVDWMADGLRTSMRAEELDRWRLFHRHRGRLDAHAAIVDIMVTLLRRGLAIERPDTSRLG